MVCRRTYGVPKEEQKAGARYVCKSVKMERAHIYMGQSVPDAHARPSLLPSVWAGRKALYSVSIQAVKS